jgi:hypothetical protein
LSGVADREDVKEKTKEEEEYILSREEVLRTAKEHILHALKLEVCFGCFATLDLPEHRCTYKYSQSQGLGRHFRTDHLNEG